MTIIMAGHETTATTLSFTLYLLLTNPKKLEKLKKEIHEYRDIKLDLVSLNKLQYLDACINESLRLYPSAWLLGRRSLNNDQLGMYHIEKDSNILISPYAIHRSHINWEKPNGYIPERFLNSDMKNSKCFLPFGKGPRICIGMNLSIIETKIILILLFRSYNPSLMPGFVLELNPEIAIQPKNGLWVEL